jgi:serine/threonine protein kinase/tetratricopeptide (TPR) repeat protein
MIGKTISHYKILEKIGGGGMGVVYKAEDTKLKRTVALKFLPTELTHDHEAKQRFVQEARAASALDHPNICNIHEIDETDDGRLFISMACYEGETLNKKIERGPLEFNETMKIIVQIAEGLAKAHAQGIVHRDIKPANIFITNDGQVKIVDFGLAKLAGETKITKRGQAMGTAAYMSPEQIRGTKIDQRTDIWSLGIVLYEMLSGNPPFKGDNWDAIIYSIFYRELEPLPNSKDNIADELHYVLAKMLDKRMSRRYSDIESFIADLQTIIYRYSNLSDTKQEKRIAGIGSSKVTKAKCSVLRKTVHKITKILNSLILFPPETNREEISIAVMPFKNLTGNQSLNHISEAITNLLITNLEQSQNIDVITHERMRDLFRLANIGHGDIDNNATAIEACRKGKIRNIVFGSFTKADNIFVTDAKVLDIKTKKILGSTTSKGNGVASILEYQIDELTRAIASGVGLPESEIQEADLSVVEVTTESMDAYNYFLRGRTDYEKFYLKDAMKHLEKCISIDPCFAMAHFYLARVYLQLNNCKMSLLHFEKAKSLSTKATERERLYIDAIYAGFVENDKKMQCQKFEELAHKYPKEKRAHYSLGWYYWGQLMFEKAIEKHKKAVVLDPNYGFSLNGLAVNYAELRNFPRAIAYVRKYASTSPGDADPYDTLGWIYIKMGLLDQAVSKYQEAIEIEPTTYTAYAGIAYCCALREQYTDSIEWIARLVDNAPSRGQIAQGYWWLGLYYHWVGRNNEALIMLRDAAEIMKQEGYWRLEHRIYCMMGQVYYTIDQLQHSRSYFELFLETIANNYKKYSPLHESIFNFHIALLNLKQNKISEAEEGVKDIQSNLAIAKDSLDINHIIYYRDLLAAEISYVAGSSANSIQKYESAMRHFKIGSTMLIENTIDYNMRPGRDLLARLYQKYNKTNKALKEYERLVKFDPTTTDRRLIHPTYHCQLAILYDRKRSCAKARKHLKIFQELWHNADKDDSHLALARQRIAEEKPI